MIIETHHFGEIEIQDEKILTFPSGLIGMKHLKRFVLLDTEKEKPFRWMQSLDDPNMTFLVIEPSLFYPDYHVAVQKDDLSQLGIRKKTDVLVLSIVTLYKEPKALTANLQGPILVNSENRIGKQVILMEAKYSSRHDIVKELGKINQEGGSVFPKEVVEIRNR